MIPQVFKYGKIRSQWFGRPSTAFGGRNDRHNEHIQIWAILTFYMGFTAL